MSNLSKKSQKQTGGGLIVGMVIGFILGYVALDSLVSGIVLAAGMGLAFGSLGYGSASKKQPKQ